MRRPFAGYPCDHRFASIRAHAGGLRHKHLGGGPWPSTLQRSRRLGHLKAIASVVVVVAFLALAVGGAIGWIGGSDDGDDGPDRRRGRSPTGDDPAPRAPPMTTAPPRRAPPTSRPDRQRRTPAEGQGGQEAQAHHRVAAPRAGRRDDVPRRLVQRARRLPHPPGGNRKGLAPRGYTRMGMAWSLMAQADISVVGLQEFEPIQYNRFADACPAGRSTRGRPSTAARSATRWPGTPTSGSSSRRGASASPTSAARSSAGRSSC